MNERKCLVCGAPEWATICHVCAADGWTDKSVMQALVDLVGRSDG